MSLYPEKMTISQAKAEDITELVTLINSGYRGEESKKGWTTEADLLEGEIRIDDDGLRDMVNSPGSVLLKMVSKEKIICGCVYLQKQHKKLYLGLLTVSPALQSAGIGRKLLEASELYAKENDCNSIYMTVISRRAELIGWYERHGYSPTGETKPFPADNRFGIPRMPLEFVILEKNHDL